MVEFTLPKNSRITDGKTWPAPSGAKNLREYRVYRWNPDDGKNPRLDTYSIDLDDCGPMVLDGLLWIKNKSTRRSPSAALAARASAAPAR